MNITSNYIARLATLSTGILISQIISFLLTAVISQQYTVLQFAELGIYISLLATLLPLMSLAYENTIMIENDDKKIHAFNQSSLLSFYIFLLISVLFIAISYLFKTKPIYLLLPLHLLADTINNYLRNLYLTQNKTVLISSNKIVSTLISCLVPIIFYYVSKEINFIIIGMLASSLLNVFINLALNRRTILTTNLKLEKDFFVQHKKFPIYIATSSIINTFSKNIFILALPYWIIEAEIGQLTHALKIISAPLFILSTSIGDLYFTNLSKTKNESNLKQKLDTFTLTILSILIIPLLVYLIYSTEIYVFIFSEKWKIAAVLTPIIAIWGLSFTLTTPVSYIPDVIDCHQQLLNYSIIALAIRSGFVFSCYYFMQNIYTSTFIFYAISILLNFMFYLYFRNFLDLKKLK